MQDMAKEFGMSSDKSLYKWRVAKEFGWKTMSMQSTVSVNKGTGRQKTEVLTWNY